jgi:hypothetical protein
MGGQRDVNKGVEVEREGGEDTANVNNTGSYDMRACLLVCAHVCHIHGSPSVCHIHGYIHGSERLPHTWIRACTYTRICTQRLRVFEFARWAQLQYDISLQVQGLAVFGVESKARPKLRKVSIFAACSLLPRYKPAITLAGGTSIGSTPMDTCTRVERENG